MSQPPHNRARIAFAGPDTPRAEVLAEILVGHGHELLRPSGPDEVLRAPQPDLYLIAHTLADGASGLALLAALRRTGRSAPVILIAERPSFEELRQAIELGVADIVLRPCEPGELAGAVARALSGRRPRPARSPRAGGGREQLYERRYPAEPGSVGWAARELSAYLMERGVVAAHRVRIASALSELVDNASRHAYPRGQGEVLVRAAIERTRVHLEVADRGSGFDHVRSRLESVRPALPVRRGTRPVTGVVTGLGRVERLCEALAIHGAQPGTSVELLFELTPVRFHEEPEDFSEIDFLDPARARALLESLRRGDTDLSGVSPALAITIGRLLAGSDPSSRNPSRR